MPRLLRAVPLIAALALAGCAGSPDPVAAPPAVAVPAPTASAGRPIADDPPGTATCGRLVTAIRDATLMDPGVVNAIVSASGTADAPVADAARRLAAAYASATTAKGSDSEPDAVAAVSAAGADMAGVCDDSGLATVG